jgi:serine/threonine protein kinase
MQAQFHHYKILKELAKKYSHSTYLAVPMDEPKRRVVLVVFSASLFSSDDEREAVLEKAEALKKLHHPHLVPIVDLGIAEQRPFVAREYVPHPSLRSYLKQLAPKRLKLQDALALLLQVGEALVYAHSQKIVHGNLKPENILLDAQGRARLTDFSLLEKKKVMVRDQAAEEYAFCYLAPEQLVGTWDASADQYMMGCLCYELITGGVPFATEGLVSLIRDWSHSVQPAPLSEKVPNLPPSLEAAVLKAMEKDPSNRFEDLSLFLEEMRAAVVPSEPAFPLSRPEATDKQKPRSFLARQSKQLATLASSHNDTALAHPLSQRPEVSSAVELAESERTIDEIFEEEEGKTAFAREPEKGKLEVAFTLVSKGEGSEKRFMLVSKEKDPETAFMLENDEVTEALPIEIDEDHPLTTRGLARGKLFLGIMLLGLVIAAGYAYIAFSAGGTNKSVQSIDPSTVLVQLSTPTGTSFSVPISPRKTLQPTQQATSPANTQPKTNATPNSPSFLQNSPTSNLTSAPTPTPTPTPTPQPPAKITVIITNLGSFQCAQVLFKGVRLGNTVTVDDMKNNRNTITGEVTGAGMFSVDFYSTNDCSGTRGNFTRTQTTVDATYSCDGSKSTNVCTKAN